MYSISHKKQFPYSTRYGRPLNLESTKITQPVKLCSSRKNPYYPHGRSLEFLGEGGGGGLNSKFLEAMYENKPEFPGGKGWGVKNKKPSVGGVWIFPGTAHCFPGIKNYLLSLTQNFHKNSGHLCK